MVSSIAWRGGFGNAELNLLHAEAFGALEDGEAVWDWRDLVERHSLGWIVARDGEALTGFLNVVWDGAAHAWIQDVMVARTSRRHGLGVRLVALARERARSAGCEWLHVDFDAHLTPFYIDACGFRPTAAGLIDLDAPTD